MSIRSFPYLFYTLIKLYYTKALSDQASSLAPNWIFLRWRPRIPVPFMVHQQPFNTLTWTGNVSKFWPQSCLYTRLEWNWTFTASFQFVFVLALCVSDCWIIKSPLSYFPGDSDAKESAFNVGDAGLIPGWERCPGEGNGNPLHYSWIFLAAQMIKNPPAMQETWVQSLSWEDPWRRAWPPTPLFLPRESHRQRSLAGFSP